MRMGAASVHPKPSSTMVTHAGTPAASSPVVITTRKGFDHQRPL